MSWHVSYRFLWRCDLDLGPRSSKISWLWVHKNTYYWYLNVLKLLVKYYNNFIFFNTMYLKFAMRPLLWDNLGHPKCHIWRSLKNYIWSKFDNPGVNSGQSNNKTVRRRKIKSTMWSAPCDLDLWWRSLWHWSLVKMILDNLIFNDSLQPTF